MTTPPAAPWPLAGGSSYVADRCLGIVLQVASDMGTLDIALRLSAATLVGVLLGLNRDLHSKSTGVRTLRRPLPRLGAGRSVDPCGNWQ
jgi:hypothetical protein